MRLPNIFFCDRLLSSKSAQFDVKYFRPNLQAIYIYVDRSLSSIIIIMTQDQLKVLLFISTAVLAFTIFDLPTLFCLVLTSYIFYRYLKSIMNQYLSKGLIQQCPQAVQNQLLNRSIFDFVCMVWFQNWFIFLKQFFKLLFKPLVEPIQPQNAIQALNDMDEQSRQVYLTKGVVRVMPEFCQDIVLGTEREQVQRLLLKQNSQRQNELIKQGNSDRTNDMSQHVISKRLIRVNSQTRINSFNRRQEQQWSGDSSSREEIPADYRRKIQPRSVSKRKPQGLVHMINHSLKMLRKIVEMQNISRHIHRTPTSSIIKVMIVFWVALLVQIKFNKSARKTVIKMLYVLGGMITVVGVVGTTGVLVYKHSRKRTDSEIDDYQP